MYKMEPLDKKKLCQCCLSPKNLRSLSKPYLYHGKNEYYQNMLKDCFMLTISQEDTWICTSCVGRLRACESFKKCIIAATKYFDNLNSINKKVNKNPEYKITDCLENEHNAFCLGDMVIDNSLNGHNTFESSFQTQKDINGGSLNVGNTQLSRNIVELQTDKKIINKFNDDGRMQYKSITEKDSAIDSKNYSFCFHSNTQNDHQRANHHIIGSPSSQETLISRNTNNAYDNTNSFLSLNIYNLNESSVKRDLSCITNISKDSPFLEVSSNDDKFKDMDADSNGDDDFFRFLDNPDPITGDLGNPVGEQKTLPYTLKSSDRICDICSKEFTFFKQLLAHMHEHYPNFVCDVCGKICATRKNLLTHIKTHSRARFNCPECDKCFKTKTSLNLHVSVRHRGEKQQYKCHSCMETFNSYNDKLKHLSDKHGKEDKIYKCLHCSCKYRLSSHLRSHIRQIHLQEKKHKCDECGEAFFRKYNLKKHIERHKERANYFCDNCNQSFGGRDSFKQHFKYHDACRQSYLLQSPQPMTFIYNELNQAFHNI